MFIGCIVFVTFGAVKALDKSMTMCIIALHHVINNNNM